MYRSIQDVLAAKELVLQKWLEFVNWHSDTLDHLKWNLHHLEAAQQTSKQELEDSLHDLRSVEENAEKFSVQVEDLDKLSSKSATVVKDVTSDLNCDTEKMLADIKDMISTIRNLSLLKEEQLDRLNTKQEEFQLTLETLSNLLSQTESELETVSPKDGSVDEMRKTASSLQVIG